MPARTLSAIATALALGLSPLVQADTLMIDAVNQAPGLERPTKGQRMADVEARYGAPREILPAVGQPPITRWVYEGYTVYFEGDTVLHAVVKR